MFVVVNLIFSEGNLLIDNFLKAVQMNTTNPEHWYITYHMSYVNWNKACSFVLKHTTLKAQDIRNDAITLVCTPNVKLFMYMYVHRDYFKAL